MTPREIGQLVIQGLVVVLLFVALFLRTPGITLEVIMGLVGTVLGSSYAIHAGIVATSTQKEATNGKQQ